MARISKPGLDYFPLDVNFLQDRKVRRISCRHHAAGIAALTSLLCLIYKEKGYYILWNKDTLFDIAQEACCGEEEMQAIIDDCLSVGLFDDLIYKEYGVLTSQAIQEQYHKIITDSRRKYKLPLEHFWLIKEDFKDVTESMILLQQCHKQKRKRIQISKVNRKWIWKMRSNLKSKKTKRQRDKENVKKRMRG